MTFRCEAYYITYEACRPAQPERVDEGVAAVRRQGEDNDVQAARGVRRSRRARVRVASCSSTGGAPQQSGEGGGGGTVDTPRMTIAMITHEVPGDSFWDLIRKGAEAAAKKDNIELRYSNDPEAPNQANLVQSAIDSKRRRHRRHAGQARCHGAGGESRLRPRAFRSSPSTPASTTSRRWASRSTSARTRSSPASPPVSGSTPTAPRRSSASSRSRARSRSNPVAPASSRASRATEILNVNGKDMPSVESTITAKLQQDPGDRPHRRARRAVRADRGPVGRQRGQHRQDRHLRHQRRAGRRDQERRRAVGRRPAALPAGLPRHRLAVAVHQQREPHRWRAADADRPVVHRQVQHRRRRRTAKAGTR